LEQQVVTTIASLLGGILLATIGFALYFGFKARGKKTSTKPKFVSANDKPEESKKASHTQASKAEIVDTNFKRIDDVFGEVTVDGIRYQTFDAGEVLIYDKKNRPVISFKIDGYGNSQRTINWIKVSEHVDEIDGVIFYVKHNHQDFALFSNWLQQQMYGGDYAREALHFKDLMEEIGKFNQLLASRKLRKGTGQYVAY
jgi:hypothetical protein